MLADILPENQEQSYPFLSYRFTSIEQVIATKTSVGVKFNLCSCYEEYRFQTLIQLKDIEFSELFNPKPQVIKSPRVWPGHSYDGRTERNLLYTYQLFDIAFEGRIKPSRKRLAKILGVHVNSIDKANANPENVKQQLASLHCYINFVL